MARKANGALAPHSIEAEQAVLGRLLIGARWADVASIVRSEDYTAPHQLIVAAIARLAGNGEPHDPITVMQQLERAGHLAAAGGLAYLSELGRNTAIAANVTAYARAVRERAIKRRLPDSHQDAESIEQLRRNLAELDALQAPPAPSITLRHIADIVEERREAEWLNGLVDILERYVLAVIAGTRNSFKSFVADHWSMLAALNGEPVVILSAEGAGLGRRIEAWMRRYAPAVDVRTLQLLALERAVNLNSAAVLEDLRAAIGARTMTPALVVIDTLSKYAPGLKENATEEMTAFLDGLSRALRDHYGCSVLIVTHSGHTDSRRPRGSSTLMATPDCEFITERATPTAMTVTVSRERYKDSPPLPALAYCAEVIDLGRTDKRGNPVTSLVMRDVDPAAVVVERKPELKGKAQRQLLAALRAHSADHAGIWTIADIREIGRKAGLAKGTARSAAEAIATSPFMTASVGGWKLTDA